MLDIFIGSRSSTYSNETELSDDDNDSMIRNKAHSSRKYRHLIHDSEKEESSHLLQQFYKENATRVAAGM